MAYLNEASYIAACLLIVSEVLKIREDIRFLLFRKFNGSVNSKKGNPIQNKISINDEDDEEERFIDVDKLQDSSNIQ